MLVRGITDVVFVSLGVYQLRGSAVLGLRGFLGWLFLLPLGRRSGWRRGGEKPFYEGEVFGNSVDMRWACCY